MEQETLHLSKKVHDLFEKRGITLSTAESCTGGLISHYITSVPGSGNYFLGGFITYSEEIKQKALGVSPGTISDHGVISSETAREMAEKVRVLTASDYSVATTGNLGPDVLEKKEKGLIYIAVSGKIKTVSKELHLKDGRDANKEKAAREALDLLLKSVEEEGP